jgi:hypothetical protein
VSELVIEFFLRFGKLIVAGLVGIVVYVVLVNVLGVTGSPQLALEAWIAGALVLLLLETSAF